MKFLTNIFEGIKRLIRRIPIFIANIVTLFFTIVIFSNSAEIVFEIDIPYAYSIKAFSGSDYLNNTNYKIANTIQQNKLTMNYGDPKIVKFPSINKRLELVNPIIKENKFLVRTNKVHQMMDQNGNTVLYLLKSWQTLNNLNDISVGENIFLDAEKGWRYIYRIDEISQVDINNNVVMPSSENPQLLIIIEDTKNRLNFIIRGEYLTIINTQR